MSRTMRELEDMNNLRADFDQCLSEKKFRSARMMINQMGESYSELEALKMHQEYNRANESIRPRKDLSRDVRENIDSRIWSSHR